MYERNGIEKVDNNEILWLNEKHIEGLHHKNLWEIRIKYYSNHRKHVTRKLCPPPSPQWIIPNQIPPNLTLIQSLTLTKVGIHRGWGGKELNMGEFSGHWKHRYDIVEESKKQVNIIFIDKKLAIKLWTVEQYQLINLIQD